MENLHRGLCGGLCKCNLCNVFSVRIRVLCMYVGIFGELVFFVVKNKTPRGFLELVNQEIIKN